MSKDDLSMETRYFVKFIGDKHVTIAKAATQNETEILRRNQYEETTENFYQWLSQNTRRIEEAKPSPSR
jgi:hypothetical protein